VNVWYRISLACGLVPLGVGVLIFIGWFLTSAHWLEVAGLINIAVGLCLFCVGVFCLLVYGYKAKKSKSSYFLRRSLFLLLVLVVNLPLASAAILAVGYIKSAHTITVENHSDFIVTEFFLTERDASYAMGAIQPNERLEREIHFKYEGVVDYSFMLGEREHKGIMFGYVTGGMGGSVTMVITKSGEVNIIPDKAG